MLFIDPRQNLGINTKGGTIYIYKDEFMNELLPIYSDFDLETLQNNPVSIDLFGTLTHGIYWNENDTWTPFYHIKDAYGATVRMGYAYSYVTIDTMYEHFGEFSDSLKYVPYNSTTMLSNTISGEPNSGTDANKYEKVWLFDIKAFAQLMPGSNPDQVTSFSSNRNGYIWKVSDKWVSLAYIVGRGLDINYFTSHPEYGIDFDVNATFNLNGQDYRINNDFRVQNNTNYQFINNSGNDVAIYFMGRAEVNASLQNQQQASTGYSFGGSNPPKLATPEALGGITGGTIYMAMAPTVEQNQYIEGVLRVPATVIGGMSWMIISSDSAWVQRQACVWRPKRANNNYGDGSQETSRGDVFQQPYSPIIRNMTIAPGRNTNFRWSVVDAVTNTPTPGTPSMPNNMQGILDNSWAVKAENCVFNFSGWTQVMTTDQAPWNMFADSANTRYSLIGHNTFDKSYIKDCVVNQMQQATGNIMTIWFENCDIDNFQSAGLQWNFDYNFSSNCTVRNCNNGNKKLLLTRDPEDTVDPQTMIWTYFPQIPAIPIVTGEFAVGDTIDITVSGFNVTLTVVSYIQNDPNNDNHDSMSVSWDEQVNGVSRLFGMPAPGAEVNSFLNGTEYGWRFDDLFSIRTTLGQIGTLDRIHNAPTIRRKLQNVDLQVDRLDFIGSCDNMGTRYDTSWPYWWSIVDCINVNVITPSMNANSLTDWNFMAYGAYANGSYPSSALSASIKCPLRVEGQINVTSTIQHANNNQILDSSNYYEHSTSMFNVSSSNKSGIYPIVISGGGEQGQLHTDTLINRGGQGYTFPGMALAGNSVAEHGGTILQEYGDWMIGTGSLKAGAVYSVVKQGNNCAWIKGNVSLNGGNCMGIILTKLVK